LGLKMNEMEEYGATKDRMVGLVDPLGCLRNSSESYLTNSKCDDSSDESEDVRDAEKVR